jgi:hypothetical protein
MRKILIALVGLLILRGGVAKRPPTPEAVAPVAVRLSPVMPVPIVTWPLLRAVVPS